MEFARIRRKIGMMRCSIAFLALALAGCGSIVPATLTQAQTPDPPSAEAALMETHVGRADPHLRDVVVKVREFALPAKHVATESIIVGPDHNLWFAELRAIATLTTDGKIREAGVAGGSDPGTLTTGPDGNVWANTAAFAPPSDEVRRRRGWAYAIYRVTPEMQRTTFRLPKNTDQMPTNLLRVGSKFYFGYQRLLDISNSESYLPLIATLDTDGKSQKAFEPNSHGEFLAWIDLLQNAGPHALALRLPGRPPNLWPNRALQTRARRLSLRASR
ncbi:MAG: hypothetical protein WA814_10075 [Candidatus Baltobacteraceae bacterium]